MPQATKELRDKWPGGLEQAIEHLKAKGFSPDLSFYWHCNKDMAIEDKDESAISYLIDEWDFGGLVVLDN